MKKIKFLNIESNWDVQVTYFPWAVVFCICQKSLIKIKHLLYARKSMLDDRQQVMVHSRLCEF